MAKAGEFVLIPPGYGHVTVNPGNRKPIYAVVMSGRITGAYRSPYMIVD